jgi:aerobic carbon-monoxide dehydrogenase medium subunit
MKSAPFRYYDPSSTDEATGLLASLEGARLIAGGQSLMPMMNMRYVMPDHVIDMNRIANLVHISECPDRLVIGAMTRQAALLASPVVQSRLPAMVDALQWVGHMQTRSRGTIGGSLCHLDPAAELPLIAALYDAEFIVSAAKTSRRVSAAHWSAGYMTPRLDSNEMLIGLEVPWWTGQHGHAFLEYARRHGDFAIVAVGCLLELDGGGRILRSALALGGITQNVMRLEQGEQMLRGETLSEALITQIAADAAKIDAMSDAYVTSRYRQKIAAHLVREALVLAHQRAQSAAHPTGHRPP